MSSSATPDQRRSSATPDQRRPSALRKAIVVIVLLISLVMVGVSIKMFLDYQKVEAQNQEVIDSGTFDPQAIESYTGVTPEEMQKEMQKEMQGEPSTATPAPTEAVGAETEAGPATEEAPSHQEGADSNDDTLVSSAVLPNSIKSSWACKSESDIEYRGQQNWNEVAEMDGAMVLIPSKCIATNFISTERHLDENGEEAVTLPAVPMAAWDNVTAPVSSDEGSTLIAAHSISANAERSPFDVLKHVESGAPIIVRDSDGSLSVFRQVASEQYRWSELATHDEFFSPTGGRMLVLVSCVIDPERSSDAGYVYNNIVVTAVPAA